MRSDRRLIAVHGIGVAFALIAAVAWPRPGQAALLVPLGESGLPHILQWADREQATLLQVDAVSGQVVARIANSGSLLRALGAGIIPISARAPGCQPPDRR